eukprot:3261876-Alexandrium_andersonii.AAC.1
MAAVVTCSAHRCMPPRLGCARLAIRSRMRASTLGSSLNHGMLVVVVVVVGGGGGGGGGVIGVGVVVGVL